MITHARKKDRKRVKQLCAVAAIVILATSVSTPAHAWGSGKITHNFNCITGPGANIWSSKGSSVDTAGTSESGNFCPSGRQQITAALRYNAGINGGGSVGYTFVSGYTSVATSAGSSSLFRGGVHRFGAAQKTT